MRPLLPMLLIVALVIGSAEVNAQSKSRMSEIVERLEPGNWYEIPNTKMSKVFPAQKDHPAWGVQGPIAVTAAWGGAAFDTNRNILVLTGGGHRNYGGNEVYEFHLDKLEWLRATNPSPMIELSRGIFAVADSEAPVSSHTYDGLVYVPTIDAVFKFGGSDYSGGGAFDKHGYIYNLASRSWKRLAEAPKRVLEVTSDFDPQTGNVIVGTQTGLLAYNPKNDRWASLAPDSGDRAACAGALDTKNRKYIEVNARTRAIAYYDLAATSPRKFPVVSGDTGWLKHPGIAYHSRTGNMLIWDGDLDVWSLNVTTWTSTKLQRSHPLGPKRLSPAGVPKSAGIFGRWQYVPSYDVFIGYVDANDNVWIYKPPSSVQ